MTNHPIKPCNECPFRRDHPNGWLGEWKAEDLRFVSIDEVPLSCHKSNDNISDVRDINIPQCAGRFLSATKGCKRFRHPQLEELRQRAADNCTDFDEILSPFEFVQHHEMDFAKKVNNKSLEAD